MKPTACIASLLTFIVIAFDVSAQQHLEPTKYLKIVEYHERVFPLLHTGFSEKPEARYTVCPSFSEEYALSVEQKCNRYYLIFNTLSRHQETKEVNVISNSFEIDTTLYQAIVELFNTATAQIKDLEIEEVEDGVTYIWKRDSITGHLQTTKRPGIIDVLVPLDGDTFYFSTTDTSGNTITGSTWSPNKNTLMLRLVMISNELCALAKDSENKMASSEIEERINLLIIDMKEIECKTTKH
jgi:hypothetical protein